MCLDDRDSAARVAYSGERSLACATFLPTACLPVGFHNVEPVLVFHAEIIIEQEFNILE